MKNNLSKDKEESKLVIALVWGGAILLCFLIWTIGALGTHWFAHHYFIVDTHENAPALFGDSFGAVNALISAFAFAGMIVTFWLQRKELKLQRDELESQRMEFAQQNETLQLQRFENTFFNLMQVQQQIIGELRMNVQDWDRVYKSGPHGSSSEEVVMNKTIQGRQVIEYLYKHLVRNPSESYYKGLYCDLQQVGLDTYKNSQERMQLDHYFAHLLSIIQFVDRSRIFDMNERSERDLEWEFKHKYQYVSMLRATLSRYEVVWLFYEGISIFGKELLKPLIEKYALLHHLNPMLLPLSKENQLKIQKETLNEAKAYLGENGVFPCDFSFLITNEVHNSEKYYVKAMGVRDDEVQYYKDYEEKFIKAMDKIL